MAGDISRSTFDAQKHYNLVLQQQGKVQLDAEWNEQGKINRYLANTANRDIIGPCGCPIDQAGFGITVITEDDETVNLSISPGRYYCDGILCENEETIVFTEQPDLPGATLPQEDGFYLAYLDVWNRHLTALETPDLVEVAVGVETTTRVKTVWQVKLLSVSTEFDAEPSFEIIEAVRVRLAEELAAIMGGVPGTDPSAAPFIRTVLSNLEEFVEEFPELPPEARRSELQAQMTTIRDFLEGLASTGTNVGTELRASVEAEMERLANSEEPDTASCDSQFPEWEVITAPSTGTLNARTEPAPPDDEPCLIPSSAGYRGLENQLYRVEVQGVDDDELVSFIKWSRNNATVRAAISAVSGNTLTVQTLGRDDLLQFTLGQWVEISNDALELTNQVGQLVQIQDINPDTLEIVIDPQSFTLSDILGDTLNLELHPKLIGWEQTGDSVSENGIPITDLNEWINLELGIQIQFSEGIYHPGDYWWICARTAIADIQWPRLNGEPVPQLPQGIQHHYCRLGLIQIADSSLSVLSDCRHFFTPLVGTSSVTRQAIHVIGTNWLNDDPMDLVQFQEGLMIELDQPPVPQTIDLDTMLVTVSVPIVRGPNNFPVGGLFSLHGQITVTGNTIRWVPLQEEVSPLLGFPPPDDLPSNREQFMRVFVQLKGQFIWSEGSGRQSGVRYLDGKVLGRLVRLGRSARMALDFPSGIDGNPSDFESWFFLRRVVPQ